MQSGLNASMQAASAQRSWKAKEIYAGSFQVQTGHPVLLRVVFWTSRHHLLLCRTFRRSLKGVSFGILGKWHSLWICFVSVPCKLGDGILSPWNNFIGGQAL